ncbi:response regulator transcription factor [Flexibacterium corallicola]|uniref:response regulator transcription factor n=1 Tax=Flexibacterium corallicola TaxID=3037259 RepID=UPI00286F5A81|nr:response regulator transcription factor [Pseudovibrio sp. M1P-2-3]
MYRERRSLTMAVGELPMGKTIIIADQHPAFAQALASTYLNEGLAKQVFTTNSFQDLESYVVTYPNSIILVNPAVEGAPGLTTAIALREIAQIYKLIILSDQDNAGLGEYFVAHGATAAISKTADFGVFTEILRLHQPGIVHPRKKEGEETPFSLEFYEGLASLTRRQATILSYLKQGKLNKQIAHDLGISEATVKHHVSALLSTLGFYSRSQLVAMINALGIDVDYRPGSRSKINQRRAKSNVQMHSSSVGSDHMSSLAAV